MATYIDNYEGWSVPDKCSVFLNGIIHRQQLPLAISLIDGYIASNNLHQAPFKQNFEHDIQSNDSDIKQYIKQYLMNEVSDINTCSIKSIFIDICALIEAAPITNNQFNMMSIQFTRITFDRFTMKHRRKCMKFIVEAKFDDGIYGVWNDLLLYDEHENNSDTINYLYDDDDGDDENESNICNDTKEVEQWLYFLKTAISEYAYHPPMDAVIFIKELKMQFNRHNHCEYDADLDKLTIYLLKHGGKMDDDKEEEQKDSKTNINTFEWLKNDLYNAVHIDSITECKTQQNEQKNIEISEIRHILEDDELIQDLVFHSTEICPIQSSEFQRLFIRARDALDVFRWTNRKKCAEYIVTKYSTPEQAKNDKDGLIQALMDINIDDSISDLIFCTEQEECADLQQVQSGDDKKEERLFANRDECEQFICSLFPHQTKQFAVHSIPKEYKEESWSMDECKRMLFRCIPYGEYEWLPNSILMHHTLHPNRAFNWSAFDIRSAVFEKIKYPQKPLDKHRLSKKFDAYLKRYHSHIELNELNMTALSDDVTNRFLTYIPVIVALLNVKLNGCCITTQTAMIEVSFRIADIMMVFKQKDPDKIVHVDLVIFYKKELMDEMEKKLKEQKAKTIEIKIKNEHLYKKIFEKITQKIGQFHDAKRCVIRIFMLLNDKTPRIIVEFGKLKVLETMDDIDEKINNKKEPIYLPHILYAEDRYENLLTKQIKQKPSICAPKKWIKGMKSKLMNKKINKEKPMIDDKKYNDPNSSDDDDDDNEYGKYQIDDNNNDEKFEDKIDHFQYSLIIFPKLLDDDESRIYITKQLMCIGHGSMPFKRTDIIDLLPMLFIKHENMKCRKKEFIDNMEGEYGNRSQRKQFFYDQKYHRFETLFQSFKIKK